MCFAFRDFYVKMAHLELPAREDYREMCDKRHMSDTDTSTTDCWDEIILDPDIQKKHSGLLLSPRWSFDQIALGTQNTSLGPCDLVSLGAQRLSLL